MSYSKDDPNQCAKDFMEHLRRVGCIIGKETSSNINNRILKIQDEKTRRELNQACNLELVLLPLPRPSTPLRSFSPT